MALALASNPIVIDEEGADTLITTGVKIRSILWYLPAASDDKASLLDAVGGNVIYKANCVTAKQGIYYNLGGLWVDGLYCDDLDSGVLYIYTE